MWVHSEGLGLRAQIRATSGLWSVAQRPERVTSAGALNRRLTGWHVCYDDKSCVSHLMPQKLHPLLDPVICTTQERNTAADAMDDEEGSTPESHPALLTVSGDAVLRFWVEVSLRPLLDSDGCGKRPTYPLSYWRRPQHYPRNPVLDSSILYPNDVLTLARSCFPLVPMKWGIPQGGAAGLSLLLHAGHRAAARFLPDAIAARAAAGVLGRAGPVSSARWVPGWASKQS